MLRNVYNARSLTKCVDRDYLVGLSRDSDSIEVLTMIARHLTER